MQRKHVLVGALVCGLVAVSAADSHAGGSGSSTRLSGGTFQRSAAGGFGMRSAATKWQNSSGQHAQVEVQTHRERNTGQGSYHEQTTLPSGKTVSRDGTVKRNPDGSVTQHGTITGPNGHTGTVDRTVTKNGTGHDTHTTYTNEKGKTLTVDKTVKHEDGARNVDGTYSTSNGSNDMFTVHGSVEEEDDGSEAGTNR